MRIIGVILVLIVAVNSNCAAQSNAGKRGIKLLRDERSLPNDTTKFVLEYEARYARYGRILRSIEPCENHDGEMDTFYRKYDLRRRLVSVTAHCSDSVYVVYSCKNSRDTSIRIYGSRDTIKNFRKLDKHGRELVRITENTFEKQCYFNQYDSEGRLVYSRIVQVSVLTKDTIVDKQRWTTYSPDSSLIVERNQSRTGVIIDSTFYNLNGTRIKNVQILISPKSVKRMLGDSLVVVKDSSGKTEFHYCEFRFGSTDSTAEAVLNYVEVYNKRDSIVSKTSYYTKGRIIKDGMEFAVTAPWQTDVIIRDSSGRKICLQSYRWNYDYAHYEDTMELKPEHEIWFDEAGRLIRRKDAYSERLMVYNSFGDVIEEHNKRGVNYDWERTYYRYDAKGNYIGSFYKVGDNYESSRTIMQYY